MQVQFFLDGERERDGGGEEKEGAPRQHPRHRHVSYVREAYYYSRIYDGGMVVVELAH